MRSNGNFIEVECSQLNKAGNVVCGDCFVSHKYKEDGRIICVLSDGLGSGIKASVLSTMTASMALNFSAMNEDILSAAQTIINTLPIDSVRKIAYSTFCICDIDIFGHVRMIEYETPAYRLVRGGRIAQIDKEMIPVKREDMGDTFLVVSQFDLQKEDRIVFFSDGVTQSGMGSRSMPFGWEEGVGAFLEKAVAGEPFISAKELSHRMVLQARDNDGFMPKDDTSCCVVYMRRPRNILVCTGPPFDMNNDKQLVARIRDFNGKKVVCGGTTAQIISRETGLPIEMDLDTYDRDIPPAAKLEGIDLITEGILTLSKLETLLTDPEKAREGGRGPAEVLCRMLLDSDKVTFLVGTRVNNAHQDPSLPVELEIRRNVVKKIKYMLENGYLKDVEINYI